MGDNPRRFPDYPLKTGEGIVFIQKYLLTTLTQRTFVLKDKRCILNDNYCLKSTQIRRQSLDLLQVTLIVSSLLYYWHKLTHPNTVIIKYQGYSVRHVYFNSKENKYKLRIEIWTLDLPLYKSRLYHDLSVICKLVNYHQIQIADICYAVKSVVSRQVPHMGNYVITTGKE